MRSLTVQIPQPCHERWADMQPTEQGRFCAGCQKTVVDYSALSDRALVRALSKVSESTCGRIRTEQLDRAMTLSNAGVTPVWRHWVSLLTLGLFGWQTTQAQNSKASIPPLTASMRPNFSVAPLSIQHQIGLDKKWDRDWVITGRIIFKDTSGVLSPLANASVGVRGSELPPIKTDSTGAFKLLAHTRTELSQLTLVVNKYGSPHRLYDDVTFAASASTIALNDVIVQEPERRVVTGGGLTIIKTPTRWQKLKRRLFH